MEKLFDILVKVLAMIAPSLKSEDSKVGVKETTEALEALNEISLLLLQRFSDGFGVDDFVAIWDKLKSDEEFKAVLAAGFDKYSEVPAEIKDTDIGEGLDLLNVQIKYLPALLDSFKKEEVVAETPVVEAPVAE